jgi:serine/threonine protein kinase
MIGQTILHYKILEKLGEGGMGVVYKARDTKLNRIVALKFLPDRVNQDNTAKERFLQEAQAVAALNHSHICTIYGIEEFNESVFMVMEFLEGGTLSDKLPYHKINDALKIAVEIGEALQEAHSKGIVHRDIKADNIMLTAKGEAKVMDFGLAKLKGALKLTRTSSTVGTLGYMAPEQIQGGIVDHRSDIFSFGVLLFEMLTGKLPFRGEHEAAIVYSVVNEEPETIQNYLPEASGELQHILSRALEKDPEDRYQSAADIVSELKRLLKHSTGERKKSAIISTVPPVSSASSADSVKTQGLFNKNKWIIGGSTGIIALGIILYLLFFNNSNSSALTSLNPNMKIHVLPIPFSQFSYSGISKDGNWLVFPAANTNETWDYYYMHVSGSESRRITSDSISSAGQDFNLGADISPDGGEVVYCRPNINNNTNDICIIPSIGGTSRRLIQNISGAIGRWRPDGKRIGYVDFDKDPKNKYRSLWSVKPDGSDSRLEFTDTLGFSGNNSRYSFNYSPDGKTIAWIRSFPEGYQELITHNLESGEERQLTFDKKNIDDVAWMKNGFIIFSSNRGGNTNLWIVPAKGGTPVQLTKGSGPDIGLSVSVDGQKLVYLQQQTEGNVWISDLKSNNSKQLTFDDRYISIVSLSPDGKNIAFTMKDIDPLKPGFELYLQDSDGNNRRQLTTIPSDFYSVNWSANGNQIAFSMGYLNAPQDSIKVYVINANDPGEPGLITTGSDAKWIAPNRLAVSKVILKNGILTDHYEIITTDKSTPPVTVEDSVAIGRSISGNMILIKDSHFAKKGFWIVPSNYFDNPVKAKAKKLLLPNIISGSAGFNSLIVKDTDNKLWQIDYATGKKQKLEESFSSSDFSVNDSNSKLAYVVDRYSAKLVLMENIFK